MASSPSPKSDKTVPNSDKSVNVDLKNIEMTAQAAKAVRGVFIVFVYSMQYSDLCYDP